MSSFSALAQLPPDPLLGVLAAYRADARAEKFDLGVGVYKNDAGETPIFRAVKTAEARLLSKQNSKVYEGPRGNLEFCAAIEDFVFGAEAPARAEGRTVSFTTPGGCGALFLAVSLMRRMGVKNIWMSEPTWPNHPNVVRSLGLGIKTHPYIDAASGGLDFAGMIGALETAMPGDGVLVQGPCHNPTGIDLTHAQWRTLGQVVHDKRLVLLIDAAYHGFAGGLSEDMAGIRACLAACGEALIAYSCSKNFGLYRERTGCFLALAPDRKSADAAASHVADLARASYSMPPAHGAGIVAEILSDAALRADWEAELAAMRTRMIGLRLALSAALVRETGSNALSRLAHENGMFSLLSIDATTAARLAKHDGLYMPSSGRINIAGLSDAMIVPVAQRLASVL